MSDLPFDLDLTIDPPLKEGEEWKEVERLWRNIVTVNPIVNTYPVGYIYSSVDWALRRANSEKEFVNLLTRVVDKHERILIHRQGFIDGLVAAAGLPFDYDEEVVYGETDL